MTTANELLQQEIIAKAYQDYRNAPRDTINHGVRPNAVLCLRQYSDLQTALTGGNEHIKDISSKAAEFAVVTAGVTPFITLIRYAMRIIIETPMIIDQAAAAQGMVVAPFGVDISTPIDYVEYVTMLQQTAAAIHATAGAIQALGE
jgi:hypothetical protein